MNHLSKAEAAYGHGLKDTFLTEENGFGFHRNTIAGKAEEHTSKNENTAVPSGIYSGCALVPALLAGPLLCLPSHRRPSSKALFLLPPGPLRLSPAAGRCTPCMWRIPSPHPPGRHSMADPRPLSPLSHSCLLALPQS